MHQAACYSWIGSGCNHSGGLGITTIGFFSELYGSFFPEGSLPVSCVWGDSKPQGEVWVYARIAEVPIVPSGDQMATFTLFSFWKGVLWQWQRGRGVTVPRQRRGVLTHPLLSFPVCTGYLLQVFHNASESYQVSRQSRCAHRCSVSSVFLRYLKAVKGQSSLSIPGRRIVGGCHIPSPFLATLFTVHSRLSLPPPVESLSLVICPLWSVLFHAAEWMVYCSGSPIQRCGTPRGPRL